MFRFSGERGICLKAIWPTPFPMARFSRASSPSDAKCPCEPLNDGKFMMPQTDRSFYGQLCLLGMKTYPDLKEISLQSFSSTESSTYRLHRMCPFLVLTHLILDDDELDPDSFASFVPHVRILGLFFFHYSDDSI